jgi:hypothetical protein
MGKGVPSWRGVLLYTFTRPDACSLAASSGVFMTPYILQRRIGLRDSGLVSVCKLNFSLLRGSLIAFSTKSSLSTDETGCTAIYLEKMFQAPGRTDEAAEA